jgi:hypothetical protein
MVLGLVQQCLDTRLREAPSTSIERLFLSPDDVFGVGIAVQIVADLRPWEWMQLLNASDGGSTVANFSAVFRQSDVDLSRAQNNALDFVVGINIVGFVTFVWDDPLEV